MIAKFVFHYILQLHFQLGDMHFDSKTDYFELVVNGRKYKIEVAERPGEYIFTFTRKHTHVLYSTQFSFLENSEKNFQLPNKDRSGVLSWMLYSYYDNGEEKEQCLDCVEVFSIDIGDILNYWVNVK